MKYLSRLANDIETNHPHYEKFVKEISNMFYKHNEESIEICVGYNIPDDDRLYILSKHMIDEPIINLAYLDNYTCPQIIIRNRKNYVVIDLEKMEDICIKSSSHKTDVSFHYINDIVYHMYIVNKNTE